MHVLAVCQRKSRRKYLNDRLKNLFSEYIYIKVFVSQSKSIQVDKNLSLSLSHLYNQIDVNTSKIFAYTYILREKFYFLIIKSHNLT